MKKATKKRAVKARIPLPEHPPMKIPNKKKSVWERGGWKKFLKDTFGGDDSL